MCVCVCVGGGGGGVVRGLLLDRSADLAVIRILPINILVYQKGIDTMPKN